MAYIDLSDNIEVNSKLIKLFGVQVALYWAVLADILQQVKKKHTFDDNGFFTLDRDYVLSRTSLTIDEQLICDKALSEIGAITVMPGEINKISISAETVYGLIIEEDPKVLKSVAKKVLVKQQDKQKAKHEGMIIGLKASLSEIDPDVRAKLADWIEVIATERKLTRPVIEVFEKDLHEYTSDKATKIKLVELAISSGYSVFDWVKNSYEKNNRSGSQGFATRNFSVNSTSTAAQQSAAQVKVSEKYEF